MNQTHIKGHLCKKDNLSFLCGRMLVLSLWEVGGMSPIREVPPLNDL